VSVSSDRKEEGDGNKKKEKDQRRKVIRERGAKEGTEKG